MNRPTKNDYIGITAIGAVLTLLALLVAFAGAGFTAIMVLAVVIGPISVYGNRYLRSDRPSRGDKTADAHQPFPG